jgi:hypothetical protein
MFNVVPGLDGKPGSVSLELGSKPGCFLVAGASTKVQVGCRSRGSDGLINSLILSMLNLVISMANSS